MSVRSEDEMVEAIALRVVELLGGGPRPVGLIDAAEVARRLGVSRTTVYEKAAELGAVRIGSGPRARLRFDPSGIEERLNATRPASPDLPSPGSNPRSHRPKRRGPRDDAGLLPIRGALP